MGMYWIGEVGDRASAGQLWGIWERFNIGSRARVGVRDGTWVPGIKVGSDKKVTEVGRMAGGD